MPPVSQKISSDPRVAVMILNYNGLKWLPLCLSSVKKTKYPNYETILIDNASSDTSTEYVRREYPSVRIIKNSTDLGFGEAYNQAIDKIEAEYVVLLNNDTQVLNPNWLTYLVDAAGQGANVGAVATKLVSMRDYRILDSVGGAGIPYWQGGFFDIGSGETDVGQYGKYFEPFAYCGGAALIRKSAFIDAGSLDRELFTQFDDPDLSWRLRLRGWRILYAPGAAVAHYRGGTLGAEVTPSVLYYCNRNFLRLIIKNCGSSLPWALRSYFLYTFLIALAFLFREPPKSIMLLRGIAWNVGNLRGSCAARRIVQTRRKLSEEEILRRMYPNLARKRAPKHVRLTRIMDALFDLSERAKFQAMIAR